MQTHIRTSVTAETYPLSVEGHNLPHSLPVTVAQPRPFDPALNP